MLLILDNHKDDLKFLYNQPDQIFADFCKLALTLINKGPNLKLYQAASQKLQVDLKQIQSGVEALAYLFIEAGKFKLSEDEFKEVLINLSLPENSFNIIYEEYLSQKDTLDSVVPQTGVQHPEFKDLEWRFEAQVSSKSMINQVQPRVILTLDLEKGGEAKKVCLQSSIPNIIHLNQLIYEAFQESRKAEFK